MSNLNNNNSIHSNLPKNTVNNNIVIIDNSLITKKITCFNNKISNDPIKANPINFLSQDNN